MTPNDYIEKAKHAIATGQPNLAMLYMQRGIDDLDARRREYLMGTWDGQLILFGEAVNDVAQTMVNAFSPVIQAAGKAIEDFHYQLLQAYNQEFFELVSE